jgi:hypothetical protein
MNDPIMNPPAIVKAVEDADSCFKQAAACAKRIIHDSLACGEWLLRAKAACAHGQWLPKLKEYGFEARTAQRLMDKARRKDEIRQLSDLEEEEPATHDELLERAVALLGEAVEAFKTVPPGEWSIADLKRVIDLAEQAGVDAHAIVIDNRKNLGACLRKTEGDAEERHLVEHTHVALAELSRSNWEQADNYAELSRRGWSARKIASEVGVPRQRVIAFIRLARHFPPGPDRPRFIHESEMLGKTTVGG